MKQLIVILLLPIVISCGKSLPSYAKGKFYVFGNETINKIEISTSSIEIFDCSNLTSCSEPSYEFNIAKINFTSDSLIELHLEVEKFEKYEPLKEAKYKLVYLKHIPSSGQLQLLNERKFATNLENLEKAQPIKEDKKFFLSLYSTKQIEEFKKFRSIESIDSIELAKIKSLIKSSFIANKGRIENTDVSDAEILLLRRDIVNQQLVKFGINPQITTLTLSKAMSQKNL